MSIRCEYDLVTSPSFMGDVMHEMALEASLKLPEGYPRINRIKGGYFRTGTPTVTVIQDGLMISGLIFPHVLYIAAEEDLRNEEYPAEGETADSSEDFDADYQPPLEYGYSWTDESVRYEEKIEIPGLDPNMFVDVEIKPVTSNFEREGAADLIFHGKLEAVIHSASAQNADIVKELEPVGIVNAQKEHVLLEEMAERKQANLTLQPALTLPSLKPELNRILDYQVNPVEISYHSSGEQAHLKGFLEVTLVYVGSDDEARPTEIFVNEWIREYGNAVPFDLSFEVDGNEKMIFVPKVSVEHAQIDMVSGRDLRCRVELSGELKVVRIVPKDIVIDVSAPAGEVMDTEKYLLNIEEFAGETAGDIIVDLEINIPPTAPEIERVLSYRTQLRDVNVEANDGKVLFDGTMDLWLEYIAGHNDRVRLAVGAWEAAANNGLPVAGILDFEGLQAGALLWSQYSVGAMKLEVAGDRTLRLTGTIQAMVVGKNPRAIMALRNCALVQPVDPETRPSMLFYVVQPGETMWKIARRYQTTVASIAKANQILNPDRIEAGQKLIIPKRILG